MAKHLVVLIDDPLENHHYDLQRTLRKWSGSLAAVVTPMAETTATAAATAAGDGVAEFVGKNDSESTRTLKNAPFRYQIQGKQSSAPVFLAGEAAGILGSIASDALILVSFVSYATTPLIVALAHADAFKGALRVGVTGVRLDTNYNLARKLIVDGLIHYHEHTRVLEHVLGKRLALMLDAHQARRRAGSA